MTIRQIYDELGEPLDVGGTGYAAPFVGDYDGDGDPDLFVANSGAAPEANALYRNEGNGMFTDVSAAAGVDDTVGDSVAVTGGDGAGVRGVQDAAFRRRDLHRGQRAGVCLAMTLATDPELLVLDDPSIAIIVEDQLEGQRVLQRETRSSRRDIENIISNLDELELGAAVVHEDADGADNRADGRTYNEQKDDDSGGAAVRSAGKPAGGWRIGRGDGTGAGSCRNR